MAETTVTKRVLILCTGNSCRSQMAEGWVRHDLGDRWEVASAGTFPARAVHPLAVRVMAEAGVDISSAKPKHVDTLANERWDLVVTVCDSARERVHASAACGLRSAFHKNANPAIQTGIDSAMPMLNQPMNGPSGSRTNSTRKRNTP